MSIDWLRDLVICIFGLMATAMLFFVAVLSFLLYRRIRTILDSLKDTTKTIRKLSSYVEEEVVKPMVEIAALIQGIRQGINTIGKFFKK